MDKTVAQIIEEVKEEMCDHYCKHIEKIQGGGEEAFEKLVEEFCDKCPLNRL